jgi:hypothetical protein
MDLKIVDDPKTLAPSYLSVSGPTGFENIDNDCISIPFLRLAQTNSPQCQPGDDKIQGLEAGMYFNPTTGKIYGKDAAFIILGFYRTWNVWHGEPPQAQFVRSLMPEEFMKDFESKTHRDEKNKIVDNEGNRYVDNRNFLLLCADYPEDGILLYPMSSTGIPASKKWLAKAAALRVKDATGNLVQAPMYSRIWQLKIGFVQSPKGNYFQVADVTDRGWVPETIMGAVKSAFEEAQAFDRSRIFVLEKSDDEVPASWSGG